METGRRSIAGSVRSSGGSRADVRSDALRTGAVAREKNVNGIAVGSILHPVNGYRGELERKGIVPTDHARKNVEAMREKAREVALKKELEAAAASAEVFKLKKFSSVESRVKSVIEGGEPREDASLASKPFLRKHEGTTAAVVPLARASVAPYERPAKESSKPPVPRAVEVATLAPREDKDFLKRNYVEAVRVSPRRKSESSSGGGSPGVRWGFGEVPQYLLDRKAAAAEEERRRAAARDDDCPAGMTLMPEEERLDTLRVLEESLAEANRTIARLPLKIETLGQIKRKTELEAKVKEIEDAIKIFSKEKVYIAEE